MAGRTLTVDMEDDDLIPAWQTVIELAESGVSAEWTLVGGLMVAAHARRAGVIMRRPTDDVDVLVDYMANRSSLSQARTALLQIGFELGNDEKHAYRFRHEDGRKLDLMVADHLPSRMEPRMDRRPAFVAPSGEQAIRRRDSFQLQFSSGLIAQVGVRMNSAHSLQRARHGWPTVETAGATSMTPLSSLHACSTHQSWTTSR